MSARKPYRLLSGKHSRFEGDPPDQAIYRAGDKIELTAAEAKRLSGRVELCGEEDSVTASPKVAPVVSAPEPPPLEAAEEDDELEELGEKYGLAELSWSDASDLIKNLATTGQVNQAAMEEKSGKARKGVLKAADERIAELES